MAQIIFLRKPAAWLLVIPPLLALTVIQTPALPPPVIQNQPADRIVGVGLPAVFRASASFASPGTSTYQWFKDGEPVAAASGPILQIPQVAMADAGYYTLRVTTASGEAVSRAARLTAVPAARIESRGMVDTDGFPMWVKVVNGHAYIADGRLHIFDISNPAQPARRGFYGTASSSIWSLAVSGTRVFLTDGSTFRILDATDITRPMLRGTVPLQATGTDVVISGNYAYVATTAGMSIVDISNIMRPMVVGRYPSATAYTVDVTGEVAYLAATTDRVHVVDVSDPENPVLITKLTDIAQTADTVKVSGNRLYAAGGGYVVYDIAEPRSPRLISRGGDFAAGTPLSNGMTARGEFLLNGGEGLSLIDLSDPSRPALLDFQKLGVRVEGVDIVDNFIYVAHGEGVEILEWLPPTEPPAILKPLRPALVVPGTPAILEASATGGGPVEWRWYHEGVLLPGETGRELRIDSVTEENIGEYSAEAVNPAGATPAGTSALTLVEPAPLQLDVLTTTDARGPRLLLQIPEGMQAELQGSNDLAAWDSVWQGWSEGEPVDLFDASGRQGPARFYRLNYGRR